MASVFWDRKGVLQVKYIERGTTINLAWHSETLTKLHQVRENKRLTKADLITNLGWKIIDYPPYSLFIYT